ncbi:MAG: ABC transporter permease [Bacteroidetes bacterium]|nr:MAG: ABC transporter permease [Bacteroidota bacterium]
MNKIALIIQREYLTRVRKKSFIVMTLIGPILMAAMILAPVYLSEIASGKVTKVAILDETGWFFEKFKDQDKIDFYYVDGDLKTEKVKALANKDLLLYIPLPELNIPVNAQLFATDQPGLNVSAYIKSVMKNIVETKRLMAVGIDPKVIKKTKTDINLITIKVDETGNEQKSNTEVEIGLAYLAGFMIYFFIFMFGAQVMKGVSEEKSNRIVEVIISSVKPFQLMMGKIVGVALVGLTQFLLWIVLTFVFVGIFQSGIMGGDFASVMQAQQGQMAAAQNGSGINAAAFSQVSEVLGGIDFKVMIFSFLFYFLGGYLLYSSLFAAIGGAVDQQADTQQFMLPVSLPLIFAVISSSVVIQQPDSAFSVWMSMIPFTSPIIMMMRIPFGVPYWQIGVSLGLLVIGFVITTWLAAKVYRVGILMYGKKVSYAELWKWLWYKE